MRHPADPGSCRWCGVDKQSHYSRWTEEARWHLWTLPTPEQIKERMIERRNARKKSSTNLP